MKFCQFVARAYPHKLTNFGRFILIFDKIALIFVFTVSSFEFQQVQKCSNSEIITKIGQHLSKL